MSDFSENTENKQLKPWLFKPGQSGNPAGKPKGARSKFAQAFVEDFARDWAEHGSAVLERIRQDDPSTYGRIACAILPKVIELDEDTKEAIHSLALIKFNAIRARAETESESPTAH